MQRLARMAGWGMLLLMLGCSTRSASKVSGVVRFDGRPLKSGTVTFLGADNQKKYSAIGKDGHYLVEGTVAGPVRITVLSHPRVPAGFNKDAPPENLPAVPNRYEAAESSGLRVDVSGGQQTHDIDLKP